MAKLLNKIEKINLLKTDLLHFLSWKGWENKHDVIMLENGNLIIIDKPSINGTLYYDDEYDAPSTKIESFISYNLFHSIFDTFDKWIKDNEDYKRIGCCSGRLMQKVAISKECQYSDVPKSHWYHLYVDFDSQNMYELLSDEENEQFINIMYELKEAYIKRLNSYYRRYQNKISTYGYWANRKRRK